MAFGGWSLLFVFLVLVLDSFSHEVASTERDTTDALNRGTFPAGFIIETASAAYQYGCGVRDREASVSVFEVGKFKVDVSKCNPSTSDELSPPNHLLIASPTKAGKYPVMIFFHGFQLNINYYSEIFKHVASHGYIVVGPQRTSLFDKLDSAASVINWLSQGLQSALPQDVQPILRKFVLAGHSKGGQDAFAVALGRVQTSLNFSAVIGIDPVAGAIQRPILTYEPHSFNISAPVLVVGTGLGNEVPFLGLGPVCAPNGVNHNEFFNECRSPRYHFVAKDYGHLDMLDDTSWLSAESACRSICGTGKDIKLMRKFVGGIIVAFLDAHLEGVSGDLKAVCQEPDRTAPVNLDPPQCLN